MMLFCEELAVLHAAFCHANQVSTNGLGCYEAHKDDQASQIIKYAIEEVLRGLRCKRTDVDRQIWAERIVVQLLLLYAANADPSLVEELDFDDEFAAAVSGMPVISVKLIVDLVERCHLVSNYLQVVDGLDKIVARRLLYEALQHISENGPAKYVDLLQSITEYLALTSNVVLSDTRPSKREMPDDNLEGSSCGIISALNDVLMLPFQRGKMETAGKVAVVQELLGCWTSPELRSNHQFGVAMSLLNLIIKSKEQETGLCIADVSRTHRQHIMEQRKTFLNSCQSRDDTSLTKLCVSFHNRLIDACLYEQERLVLPVMLVNDLIEVTSNILQDSTDILRQLKQNSRVINSNDVLAIVTPTDINTILLASIEALSLKQKSLQSNLMSASALESLINALTQLQEEYASWLNDCLDLTSEEQLTLNMYLIEEGMNSEDEWNWIIEDASHMDPRWLDFLDKHHKNVTFQNLIYILFVWQNPNYFRLQGPLNFNILQQVIIKSYNNLLLEDKNKVLKDVYKNYRANQLLFEENMDKKLTTVFNRITSQKLSKEKAVLADVALLALQNLPSVVEKIVQTAVCNSGQSVALVQVLQNLPFLHQAIIQDKSWTRLSHNLQSQFCAKLSRKEQENGLKFLQLLFQKSLLSPLEAMEQLVLPFVFKQSETGENDVPILLTLEIMHLVLDTSESFDWLSSLKVPPIMFCLCDLIDSCRRKWAEQETDSEAEQIVVIEKAVQCLQLSLDEVLCHLECMPVAGVKWLYQKMAEYPWYLSLYLIQLYDLKGAAKLPMMMPKNSADLLDFEDRVIKMCAKEDKLAICLYIAQTSDDALQLLLSSVKPGMSVMKGYSFEKLVSVVVCFLQQSTVKESLRIGEVLSILVAAEDYPDLPLPADDEKSLADGSHDGYDTLWLMKVIHNCVLITANKKCESFSHLTHMARIGVALTEKYCIDEEKLDAFKVAARAVQVLVQAFLNCSLQVASLPEICEDQLGVLALHVLTSLAKKLGSCDQESVYEMWSQHKDSVHRCLQLWSEEKQCLFLKKIPS